MLGLGYGVFQIVVIVRKRGVGLDLADTVGLEDRAHRYAVIQKPLVLLKLALFDRGAFPVKVHRRCQRLLIRVGKRRRLVGGLRVVQHLLQRAHAGEDGDHPIQIQAETQRPGSDAPIRVLRAQKRLRFFRESGKAAALDRLHDDDLAAMSANHIITKSRLHQLAVPIDGVECDLNELDFRVLSQNPIQQLRRGMEGNAQVADLAVLLPLLRMLKEMCRLYNAAFAVIAVVVDGLDVVQKIVINIVHPEMIQLALEGFLDFLLRDQHKGRELRRHGEAV